MKKLTLILGVVAAVITLSCSKESAPSLVGKWRFYEEGIKGTGSTIVWEANTDDACEAQSFFQLNADGSIYQEYYDINPLTSDCELYDDSQSPFTQTWRKEGDDIILTQIDNSVSPPTSSDNKAKIYSLSSSELILQQYNQAGTTLIDSYSKLIRK
jgi:hypothetical protein